MVRDRVRDIQYRDSIKRDISNQITCPLWAYGSLYAKVVLFFFLSINCKQHEKCYAILGTIVLQQSQQRSPYRSSFSSFDSFHWEADPSHYLHFLFFCFAFTHYPKWPHLIHCLNLVQELIKPAFFFQFSRNEVYTVLDSWKDSNEQQSIKISSK